MDPALAPETAPPLPPIAGLASVSLGIGAAAGKQPTSSAYDAELPSLETYAYTPCEIDETCSLPRRRRQPLLSCATRGKRLTPCASHSTSTRRSCGCAARVARILGGLGRGQGTQFAAFFSMCDCRVARRTTCDSATAGRVVSRCWKVAWSNSKLITSVAAGRSQRAARRS